MTVHRAELSRDPSRRQKSHASSHKPSRHHRTGPTVCSRPMVPRSWVRSPPALPILRNNVVMSIRGTASYDDAENLPIEVSRAVQVARSLEFDNSCRLEQGRLLQVIAHGYQGGVIGETGSGCGVGLSWMLSGASSDTRLYSVESDAVRAMACQELFEDYANVSIENDDWTTLVRHGPFDLLVLDGGGSGKSGAPVLVSEVLNIGGTLVVDDFTPFVEWPPAHEGERDHVRLFWLEHPNLRATEIRLAPDLSTIVGTRIT